MRRIVTWLLATFSVVLLMFGYHTSTSGTTTALSTLPGYSSGTVAGSTSSGSASTSGGATSSGGADTVTGATAQTRWGPVQVQLTVAGGSITGVQVLQYPTGSSRDDEINSYALPILVQETMDAQGGNIDMVSGATVTSGGYTQSLQSALDQAGL